MGRKGATSAPKSAEGALRGCRTAPSPTTSTIRRYCAHHDQRYISHPDEEGERQFRLAPFGHSWKKTSARGSVGASSLVWIWPLIHFLLRMSGGRRISAQRQLLRGGARYSALHRLHTTTLQSGPVWEKILSPLQMDTPYKIFAKIPREPEKIRDATTTLLRPRAPRWHTHSFFKNVCRDSPSSYYSGPNLNPQNCENAFSARDLSFLEFVVPYESGARRITSNLGSDLFCPLWLVGLAHLEWRARVARSCCIGRRWSVGCSPLVLDRSSWSVVGSFLKFGRNSTCCQYGGGNVLPLPGSSLSQLFGVDHLSSRSPLHRLGEGQGRGGKRLPRAALLPHCDRCLTGASALDFGHPHVEWKAEHAFWAPKSTKSFLAHLEHYAAARVHSATLWENRPSHGPHGEWHQGFPRLGPKRRLEVLWRISARSLPRLWPESALCRLHFGRPLGHNQGVQRVSTKTKECASALPVTFGGDSLALVSTRFTFTSDEFDTHSGGPRMVHEQWVQKLFLAA